MTVLYGNHAILAKTKKEVQCAIRALKENGCRICEIHMQGAYSGGPPSIVLMTLWARTVTDEELRPLLRSLLGAVWVVPIVEKFPWELERDG